MSQFTSRQLEEADLERYQAFHKEVFTLEDSWLPDDIVLSHLKAEQSEKESMNLVGILDGEEIVAANLFSTIDARNQAYPILPISVPWFLGIKKEYRGSEHGLLGKLLSISDRVTSKQAIRFGAIDEVISTVIEVNDPTKMNSEEIKADYFDPFKRRESFRRYGFRAVPKEVLDYVEPAGIDDKPDRKLGLMIRNNREQMPVTELRAVLNGILRSVVESYDIKFREYRKTEDYKKMSAQLSKIKPGNLITLV